jgi:hypothetical protein
LLQPNEQAAALSAQLRIRCFLSCLLSHFRLVQYLIIPFAFPGKELRKAYTVVGTEDRHGGRAGIHTRQAGQSSSSRSIPELETPASGSGLGMQQGEEAMCVV